MKKLLNVIKKIICVFGGIILLLAVQASISSILRLINPTEELQKKKKNWKWKQYIREGHLIAWIQRKNCWREKSFMQRYRRPLQNSVIGRKQGEEYQKSLDHVIATFENSNYVIMLCQSRKGKVRFVGLGLN